jgi:hypothetical protein
MMKLFGVLLVLSILPIALISGCVQEPAGAVCGNGVLEAGEECESDADCVAGKICTDCACEPIPAPPELPE